MAEIFGLKPEIINAPVNDALAKAKASPAPNSVWEVVRQLGQGELTVVNTTSVAPTSAFDPTSLPGDFVSQAMLALNSDKGPLLVAFTARNVSSILPENAPATVEEQQIPAGQVAAIASKEPYAGLAIDPGSPNGYVIPSAFLGAGLPIGRTNHRAKALLANATTKTDVAGREALVAAIAGGPMYTAAEKVLLEASGEVKFPLVPLDAAAAGNGAPGPDLEAAVVFGTSPAEIAAVFSPEQWTPIPVKLNDVVATVRKNANLKLVVINPLGPTLQLPITADMAAAPASSEELLSEPTPEPGSATEPDGGTREGED